MIKIKIIEEIIPYTGSELKPHWIFHKTGIVNDAVVAFRGPCDVPVEKMVDLVDVRDNKPIFSKDMIHMIGEFYSFTLKETILLQRLLVSLAQQEIIFSGKDLRIIRGGNDLYEGDSKLSVAIAAPSTNSTLIHFGINIDSTGTPVKTKGLKDYNLDPMSFAKTLLESFKFEYESLLEAKAKVRSV